MNIRLTKYNPVFRDSSGRYLKDEWTSSSDIGSVFNGDVLTLHDYLSTEEKLVTTAINILDLYGCNELAIDALELYDTNGNMMPELTDRSSLSVLEKDYLYSDLKQSSREMLEALLAVSALRNGQKVSLSLCKIIMKLCLRDVFWLRLIGDHDTYVHFEYDYYMYLGTGATPKKWTISIPEGVFVEFSPYYKDYEDDDDEDESE